MRRRVGLTEWAVHLRGLARTRLDGPVGGAPAAFLKRCDGVRDGVVPSGASLDEALWWAVVDGSVDPLLVIEADGDGPLFAQGSSRTIEVWTERELCGLHALWWVAELRRSDAVAERVWSCARWHVERTQPDNATNRPWAAHVFLLLAERDDDASARLYAETLIHNCQTNHGVPDALSGLILLDCAAGLSGLVGAD